MKKIILLYIIIFYSESFSQNQNPASIDTTSLNYNLSIGASNPAFDILGLAPSGIERPKDPNNFALLLQNATENFSIIPKNYSIEVSSWVFRPKIDYTEFKSNDVGDNILQTMALSFATSTSDSANSDVEITRLGIGLKFSLSRGSITSSFTKMSDEYVSSLNNLAAINEKELEDNRNKDEEYAMLLAEQKMLVDSLTSLNTAFEGLNTYLEKLNSHPSSEVVANEIELTKNNIKEIETSQESFESKLDIIAEKITERMTVIDPVTRKELVDNEERKEIIKKLEEEAEKVQFIRKGFKLDFACATAFEFTDQISRMNKTGFWAVSGWDWLNPDPENFTSLLGLVKGAYERDSNTNWKNLYDMVHSKFTYDIGIRFIQNWSVFSVSIEGLFRDAFSKDTKSKYLINVDYNAGDNKLIVFSLGKDFDSVPNVKGNFIAALNFLLGLGSNRPFQE